MSALFADLNLLSIIILPISSLLVKEVWNLTLGIACSLGKSSFIPSIADFLLERADYFALETDLVTVMLS